MFGDWGLEIPYIVLFLSFLYCYCMIVTGYCSSQLRISQELFFFVVPESFPRETSVMLKNDVTTALGSRKKKKSREAQDVASRFGN